MQQAHRQGGSKKRSREAAAAAPPARPPPRTPPRSPPPSNLTHTLLPGYASRPGATLVVPPPVLSAADAGGEEEEGGFVKRRGRVSPPPPQPPPPPPAFDAAAAGGFIRPGDDDAPTISTDPPPPPAAVIAARVRARRPRALTGPPLPSALAALETRLLGLMAAHDYLTRRHVSPTWRLLALALAGAAGAPSAAATLADAVAGAALAPDLVTVRGRDAGDAAVVTFDRPRTRDDDRGSAGARPRGETRAATLRSALASAADNAEAAAAVVEGEVWVPPPDDDGEEDQDKDGDASDTDQPYRWRRVRGAPLSAFTAAVAAALTAATVAPPAVRLPPPTPDALLDSFCRRRWYQSQIVATTTLPPQPARASAARGLPPAVARAAAALVGVDPPLLYDHQIAALEAAATSTPFIVTTPTASGKSLCFVLPIVAALASDPAATALILFPTKALAQDQLPRLQTAVDAALGAGAGAASVAVFDGDTAPPDRAGVVARARVLLSNPDMLHRTVLPAASRAFAPFLTELAVVAVDEAHAYGGALGGHTALVLRRLRRAVDGLRAADETRAVPRPPPLFLACSATVANAADHAGALLGLDPIRVIYADGSPAGAKTFVIWNPPLVERRGGGGGGPATATRRRPPDGDGAVASAHAAAAATASRDRDLLRVGAPADGSSVFGGRAGGAPPPRRRDRAAALPPGRGRGRGGVPAPRCASLAAGAVAGRPHHRRPPPPRVPHCGGGAAFSRVCARAARAHARVLWHAQGG